MTGSATLILTVTICCSSNPMRRLRGRRLRLAPTAQAELGGRQGRRASSRHPARRAANPETNREGPNSAAIMSVPPQRTR
jgi:hypothetical protein